MLSLPTRTQNRKYVVGIVQKTDLIWLFLLFFDEFCMFVGGTVTVFP